MDAAYEAVLTERAMRMLIEWEADVLAMRMCAKYWEQLNLSAMAGLGTPSFERWRAVLATVGAAIQIFEKARLIYGDSGSYPTPRTRLFGVASGVIINCASRDAVHELGRHGVAISMALEDIRRTSHMLIPDEDTPDVVAIQSWRPVAAKFNNNLVESLRESMDIIRDDVDTIWHLHLLDPQLRFKADAEQQMVARWFEWPRSLTAARRDWGNELLAPFRSPEVAELV